ncbi:hypothetical protein F7984_06965 [Pradoshia sp. D12]|uniref:hypothetical protein n=1 Tax=Bacillaceae TaxID=186817 RepID=UPI00080AF646|nr:MULTISPECIES: hypothetical protein [Bacillaceae]OCA89609.1 hypothetical protein A8L44_01315 [Bacillus sp. FJAT-27986]QFK71007.1 hypothetical protein F7984_06965 [Pradoshia sp. D12]TPF72799.1 hypothetical protein FHY44_03350 [Bacillus sp. D12]
MTFILIVSIMVNMVAVLAIVILYLRQNRLIQFEKECKEYQKEVEELIHTFIIEMKEENDEIKQLFVGDTGKISRTEGPRKLSDQEEKIDHTMTGLPNGYRQQSARNAYENTSRQSVTNHLKEEKTESDVIDQDLERVPILAEAQNMKNQGKTIEEIAKKMGRGKTEIDLLFKLNQK